jgi:hypothetical protein
MRADDLDEGEIDPGDILPYQDKMDVLVEAARGLLDQAHADIERAFQARRANANASADVCAKVLGREVQSDCHTLRREGV